MPQPLPLPPPGFDELSVDEKIDYLQSLWARIAATPETVPVPDWHRQILDQRLKDLEANPESGDSWDVVQERLRKKLDSKHWIEWPEGSSFGRWRKPISSQVVRRGTSWSRLPLS